MFRAKKIALFALPILLICGVVSARLLGLAKSDPVPIKVDRKILADYAGFYDFRNGHILTLRCDGERLMSWSPNRYPREMLAQTETNFFVKGEIPRFTFQRDKAGQVTQMLVRWKKGQETAQKLSALPPALSGTNGMIAATTGGKALEAGMQILKEGGSAADAAMATALCEVVHAGGSYVSFAGIMMMMYYEAASGKVYYMDAEYNTPLEEKSPGSIPRKGGRTALVPGFFAGVQAAHDRFGKLSLERIFAPAIAIAEKGETVTPVMEWWINSKKSVLSRYPETKRIFTNKEGKFLKTGELFRQSELAETLRRVASQGAAYIYEGEWASKFVDTIQREGGKITLEDMKNYKVFWEEPLHTSYRDYEIYAPGLSTWGGPEIIEAFNLLELANLKQYGHYTISSRALFWLMQISACHTLTWNYASFTEHDLSPKSRATKETSAWIWGQMQNGQWRFLPKTMRKPASSHTDGLVLVDKWGNVAAVNHTINTVLWGNTGLFVDGISIPDSAAFQPNEVAKAGPGHRLPNGMSPLLILRDGKPVLGSAATGGGLHAKTLQVLLNILDFDMDPQTAVDTPAFVGWNPPAFEEGTFDPGILEGLKTFGMKAVPEKDAGMSRGYWTGIQIDPATGHTKGGVSSGMEGAVVGY
jgi:gamma-glutamyltranspeptidase / glutathione hydrolase